MEFLVIKSSFYGRNHRVVTSLGTTLIGLCENDNGELITYGKYLRDVLVGISHNTILNTYFYLEDNNFLNEASISLRKSKHHDFHYGMKVTKWHLWDIMYLDYICARD